MMAFDSQGQEGSAMPRESETERRIAELEEALSELCKVAPLTPHGKCVRCKGGSEDPMRHERNCPWRRGVEAL